MQIMAFLHEAHCRGVLRQVGGSYQFRHAELKEALLKPAQRPAAVAAEPVAREAVAEEQSKLETVAKEGSAP
jgi:hypothetical protein